MQDFIQTLKINNPHLNTSELIGLLYIINTNSGIENNELIRLTGIQKTIMKQFKASIASMLEVPKYDEITLTDEGKHVLAQLDLVPHKWTLVTYSLPEIEQKILKIREDYNLDAKREYDQFFATPNSTVAKAKLAIDKGLVDDKNIVFIGDDDLVSLAIAFIRPTYKSIKILDIDDRVLTLINKVAQEYDLPQITTEKFDIRNEVTKKERSKFDTVFIDPPYTLNGATLFIHRSLELLNLGVGSKHIILNYGVGPLNSVEETKIQGIISSLDLVIVDKINNFTKYMGAETVGSSSSIYVLKTTEKTSIAKTPIPSEIYTHESSALAEFPPIYQYTYKLHKVPQQIIISKSQLQKILGEFCKKHGLKVLDINITKFSNKGLSIVYILGISSLSVHTWPEKNAIYIDLVTCALPRRADEMAQSLSYYFKTDYIEVG